ncbi:hypothetical protein ACOMHN_067463 [Nucella lapillus]
MGLSSPQKFCIAFIIIGILLLLVGTAAPFWLTYGTTTTAATFGLWFGCVDGQCGLYKWGYFTLDDFSIWFYLVHGLAGISALIACVMLFASCCSLCGNSDKVTATGVVVMISGFLAIAAGAMFWSKPFESFQFIDNNLLERDWAFYVFGAGSILITLFSIILLILPGSKNSSVSPS